MIDRPHPPVVVAVPTFRRHEQLAALVPLLIRELDQLDDGAGLARILIIDNDPDGGARFVTEELKDFLGEGAGARLQYVCEPTAGVVAVRNRALDESPRDALLAFIDDDEKPVTGWLRELVSAQRTTGAAAVSGPVISHFPDNADDWVVAGGFFERRHRLHLADGDPIEEAATNNLLVDLASVHRLGLRFDPRFALSGGEDSHFTRLLHRRGGRLVWCPQARVSEEIPAARLNRGWIRRRAVSLANSHTRVDLALADRALIRRVSRLENLGNGLLRIAAGSLAFSSGVLARSVGRRARGVRTICRGIGMASGALGWTYLEYQRGARRWRWDPS